jgi:hypothetical protein
VGWGPVHPGGGRYAEAIHEYEDGARAQPQPGCGIGQRRWCKIFLGLLEKAILAQEGSIRLSPRDRSIWNWDFRVAQGARLTRAELAFADHPLVPVHLMLDPVAGRVAFAKEQANDFEAAFSGMLDTPLREKFHRLTDAVFVL